MTVLPGASIGRLGGDRVIEGRDGSDVRAQPSVLHPLDDLAQLGTTGPDNEVDRQPVGGPCLAWPDDGHQRSSGSNQARGPLPDVAADDIEHQVDAADIFQGVVLKIDELLRAEVERLSCGDLYPGAAERVALEASTNISDRVHQAAWTGRRGMSDGRHRLERLHPIERARQFLC